MKSKDMDEKNELIRALRCYRDIPPPSKIYHELIALVGDSPENRTKYGEYTGEEWIPVLNNV
jgi:hypothetical protein